jgi:hypothetical protein
MLVSTMRALGVLVLATAVTGCSGGGSGDPMGAGGGAGGRAGGAGGLAGLTCAEQEFAIEGTLDGQAVSHRGVITGHAWIQGSTPSTLDVPFEGGGRLHAEWDGIVADGEIFAATGSLTLPASGPHAGETLDSADATMRKVAEQVDFELTGLSVEVVCATTPCPPDALDGTLQGCVRWRAL